MGVDHGRLHIAVTQQLLNRANVGALLQQVCGERMAEAVAGGWLADPRRPHSSTHGPLHKARIQVVSPLQSLVGIPPAAALGEQPLPGPFPCRIPLFPLQGVGQLHRAPARRQIGLMHTPHGLHVPLQGLHQARGQHGAIEKQQGRQRLVLRGGTHSLLCRQMAQECIDLSFPHRARMAHPVEAQEPPQPVLIARYRAASVVARLQFLTWSGDASPPSLIR